MDSKSLNQFDLYLSGERADSNLTTRNSFLTQVYSAANWIQGQFVDSGFTVTQGSFQSSYGPNVIAKRGTTYPNTYVMIGGHYDSRALNSASGTARAPGANDDGSGTSALLEIARLIAVTTTCSSSTPSFSAPGVVRSRASLDLAPTPRRAVTAVLTSAP